MHMFLIKASILLSKRRLESYYIFNGLIGECVIDVWVARDPELFDNEVVIFEIIIVTLRMGADI